MRSGLPISAVTICAVLAFGCADNIKEESGADEAVASAAAQVAVAKRMDDYVAAIRADKLDSLADYFTEDVVCFEPEVEYRGRAAFIAGFTAMMKAMKVTEVSLNTSEMFVHDHGAVVYQFANVDYTLASRDGKGTPQRARVNLVARWEKEPDGTWRIDRLMETPMPPLPAAGKAGG